MLHLLAVKPSTHTEYNGAYDRRYIFSEQTVDKQRKEITVEVAVKNLTHKKTYLTSRLVHNKKQILKSTEICYANI